jgi:AraC-like DNA-binding protein/ligand-binding sensor protein
LPGGELQNKFNGTMPGATISSAKNRVLVDRLRRSEIYQEYERAFREMTGLPLGLCSVDTFNLPHRGDPNENPFCSLMAKTNRSCAACLQMQRKIEDRAKLEPKTLKCFAGLCDSAVPVRVGENLIAFLRTGQILMHRPNRTEFAKTSRILLKWGAEVDLKRLEEAYFQTRVLSTKQYESVLRLLTVFSQHLSSLSNQLMIAEGATESPVVRHAREYIVEHHAQEISLGDAARSVNMSTFYFCKTFKMATGMTFTDFLARVRVEKVKNMMLNPHKRISEAAFESGFQSLSQFNRVFRRLAGESPSAYRERIPKIEGA